VSAYRRGEEVIVMIPAEMTRAEEKHWVAEMLARLRRSEARRPVRASDEALFTRCGDLSRRYLAGRAVPAGVRWVPSMRTRWASCTPANASIRISEKLRTVPPWVLDYVLLHELAHLLVPGHGKDFWALLVAYPRTERARGYLEGFAAVSGVDSDEIED
jgi:predicted metal-dependent hydrolase